MIYPPSSTVFRQPPLGILCSTGARAVSSPSPLPVGVPPRWCRRTALAELAFGSSHNFVRRELRLLVTESSQREVGRPQAAPRRLALRLERLGRRRLVPFESGCRREERDEAAQTTRHCCTRRRCVCSAFELLTRYDCGASQCQWFAPFLNVFTRCECSVHVRRTLLHASSMMSTGANETASQKDRKICQKPAVKWPPKWSPCWRS